MMIVLDREFEVPLHTQISVALRRQIEGGELPAGARLPSSRDLAEEVGVNRATVVQSYRELKSAGLIESGVGRGSFVAASIAAGSGSLAGETEPPRLCWRDLLDSDGAATTPVHASLEGADERETLVPLARAVAHPGLYPTAMVSEHLDRALGELGSSALGYAPPAGYEPLRAVLRQRFEARGLDMSEREVLVTGGSQQGLDLVARLLPARGSIYTSTPTFSGALKISGRYHECTGVALDHGGLDPRALAATLHRRGVQHKREKQPGGLIYTLPCFHNPTGIVQSRARGDAILEVARRHGLAILEDDWLGDLRKADDPPPLAGRDAGGNVLYLGTASKVLVPGLRLGWLVALVPLGTLVSLKSDTDLATNLPAQAALHRLLVSGAYDEHAATMQRALERRRQITLEAIATHLPADVRPLVPGRGMVMWIQLPPGTDQDLLVRRARALGVDLAGGHPFVPAGLTPDGFRISYAEAAEEQLAGAIAALGEALHQTLGATPVSTAPPLV